MVHVKFSTKGGKIWDADFPHSTMKDVRFTARGINPNINKVEYFRKLRV